MNTTTTQITAESGKSPVKVREATLGKRRMARETGYPTATGKRGEADAQPPAAPSAPTSKIASVIALLEREQGATLAELVEATGWLPHTTRAALTGLKKKGHTLSKGKRDDVTCYRIVKAG